MAPQGPSDVPGVPSESGPMDPGSGVWEVPQLAHECDLALCAWSSLGARNLPSTGVAVHVACASDSGGKVVC